MIKDRSKRYKHLKSLIIEKKAYSIDEGINLLKILSNAKFLETIEAHFCLNIDTKQTSQQVRNLVDLPHGNGKKIRIAILTDSDQQDILINEGATIVGFENLISNIQKGQINFDLLLTSHQFMPKMTSLGLGKILGPKGLMPSPKFGTVTENFIKSIQEFKKGKSEYRADKTGIVHLSIGKTNFPVNYIKDNLAALHLSLEKNKPQSIKGKFFKSLYICSTMSPSLEIDLQSIK
jgi:large subunit ribosomal protein L1